MPYKDLREFMDFLKREGELQVCDKEVDTRIEIAKVTDKSSKVEGPAILFNHVKGFETPVVTGLFGTLERSFLAIESNKFDAFKKMAKALEKPIPYKVVKDGPCKEVVRTGEKIDLRSIPVLWHHAKDSHKYITATVCRCKNPDTGISNNSINRIAVQGKNRLTIQAVVPHQVGIDAPKYLERGRAFPIAIAVGTDPATFACSSYGLPYGMDEVEFTGGIIGRPIEMVKCETIDVEVPATSELVIEGEIRPGDTDGKMGKTRYAGEAPFGEISGYFGPETQCPIIYVTAITHRQDYIYHGLGTAEPPSEHQILQCFASQGNAFLLAKAVIPPEDIISINPLVGSCGFAAVISIKKRHPGQVKQVIYAILTKTTFKKIIVVDDDINVFNPVDVEWAVSFRAGPEDYIMTAEMPGVSLDPMVDANSKLIRKIGIDATLPLGGDKKGRLDILRELGPARYPDLDEIHLEDYISGVTSSDIT